MMLKKTAVALTLSLGLIASANAVDYVDSIASPIQIPGFYTGGHLHGAGDTFADTVNFTVTDLFTIGGQVANTFNIGGLDLDLNSVKLWWSTGAVGTADDVLVADLAGTTKLRTGTGTFSFAGDFYYVISGVTTGASGGSYSYQINTLAAPVPEPETYAMLLAGLGLMGTIARRRKSKAA